jgi:SRSO17 transposase
VVPPPLGASIQAIVSPAKNEGIPEGKTDNCQVAVTLSIANHAASLPIDYRLYLPEDWANDEARRKKARVPDHVEFQTKPQIALAQLEAAIDARVPRGIVLADAGYGSDGAFVGTGC